MKSAERVDQITDRMWSAIDYCKREYDVNYAEMIGILNIIIMDIYFMGKETDDSST
jgi:hypothetical protein